MNNYIYIFVPTSFKDIKLQRSNLCFAVYRTKAADIYQIFNVNILFTTDAVRTTKSAACDENDIQFTLGQASIFLHRELSLKPA